jgi:hypothetical protein
MFVRPQFSRPEILNGFIIDLAVEGINIRCQTQLLLANSFLREALKMKAAPSLGTPTTT